MDDKKINQKIIEWFENHQLKNANDQNIYSLYKSIKNEKNLPEKLLSYNNKKCLSRYTCKNLKKYLEPWEYLDVSPYGDIKLCFRIAYCLQCMPQCVSIYSIHNEPFNEDFYSYDKLSSWILPFESETYKLITCFRILSTIEEDDLDTFLISVHNSLQKGGLFVISEFDCQNLEDKYTLLSVNHILSNNKDFKYKSSANYKSREEWIKLITSKGFKISLNTNEKPKENLKEFCETFEKIM